MVLQRPAGSVCGSAGRCQYTERGLISCNLCVFVLLSRNCLFADGDYAKVERAKVMSEVLSTSLTLFLAFLSLLMRKVRFVLRIYELATFQPLKHHVNLEDFS